MDSGVNWVDMSSDSQFNTPSPTFIENKQPKFTNSVPCSLRKKMMIPPKEKHYVNLISACNIQSDKFISS